MTDNKTKSAPKGAARKSGSAGRATNHAGPAGRRPAIRNAPTLPPDGTVDEAINRAQQGRVNVSPAKAVEMAGQLYGRRQFAQAERVCRQILERLPGNADAHNVLGVALSAQGKSDDAIEELRAATKLAPEAAAIRANLGEVLRQSGQLDDAERELEEAVRLEPN